MKMREKNLLEKGVKRLRREKMKEHDEKI